MNRDFACQSFESCRKTQTVVQSGFNAEGLWNFQGHSPGVVTTQQVFINIKYDEFSEPKAIGGPIQLCGSYERALAYGANASLAGNATCPPSTCSETGLPPSGSSSAHTSAAEAAALTRPLYSTWSGFRWVPVVIFYGVLLVCSALITTYTSCSRKQAASDDRGGATSSGQEPLLGGGGQHNPPHGLRPHAGINAGAM